VVDDAVRPALADRHVEGGEDEIGPEVVGHRPAGDAAAEDIQHHGQVEEPRPGRDAREILSTNAPA
jgi:hypothetical protein